MQKIEDMVYILPWRVNIMPRTRFKNDIRFKRYADSIKEIMEENPRLYKKLRDL